VIEIKMPRLSDTMSEGAISTWRKQPGDAVSVGDPLVEIETDKAVMEYEAYEAGTLTQILVPEGETVEIGAPIALIDDGKSTSDSPERSSLTPPVPAPAPAPAAAAPVSGTVTSGTVSSGTVTSDTVSSGTVSSDTVSNGAVASDTGSNGTGTRQLASPLVRKIARENHLDLSGVTGTGPGGRVIRADITGLLGGVSQGAAGSAPQGAPAPFDPLQGASAALRAPRGEAAPPVPAAVADADDVRASRGVPISNVRRVIARRLSASAREIPHFYVTAVADAEALMDLRATLNAQLTAAGRAKVSVNDLLIRAVALALREHPDVNASYVDDASTTMLVHDRINVGVAVAAATGLIVPVIRDADTKTVTQLGTEAKQLVSLANERKLTPDQTSGGTFTISNLGMFGVEHFTAIINPPESAILAVGATTREPTVVGDTIVPRYRLRYTLSVDHRVIDGALAAQFLKTLTKLVETPWMIVA
jgi:pyruvate dehydrogenase E2 component (dihydrolipoamide acetyltransferase)